MTITILGLGHGDPRALTLEAHEVLHHAREIFLRTREHPTVAALPPHLVIHSFDHLYTALDRLDDVYTAIAETLVEHAARADVLYAVPGHPLFGETSVQKMLTRARAQNIPTRLIVGTSFVDAVCAALELDPLARGLQIADATDLARQHFPRLDPDQPVLVAQVYSRTVASDCKLTLLTLYPPEHPITRVDAAGTATQKMVVQSLAEIDHVDDLGLLTVWYVPPLERPSGFSALGQVVAHLRAPEGCPWDRTQTHQSLRQDFLEECYEVLDALDRNDIPHLREELGDLMLHIFLQAQIAAESGEFLLTDVIADITAKLIRRHPHVFGDVQVRGTREIMANWERIKQTERNDAPHPARLPRTLPALARAQKIARRHKVKMTAREIQHAAAKLARAKNRERALGQVLFALAAYAANQQIDAESALRAATLDR